MEKYLYHYYDKRTGPFCSLSDLKPEEANAVMEQIRQNAPNSMAAKRQKEYMDLRLHYEAILRYEFAKKGGRIERQSPII